MRIQTKWGERNFPLVRYCWPLRIDRLWTIPCEGEVEAGYRPLLYVTSGPGSVTIELPGRTIMIGKHGIHSAGFYRIRWSDEEIPKGIDPINTSRYTER